MSLVPSHSRQQQQKQNNNIQNFKNVLKQQKSDCLFFTFGIEVNF